MKVVVYVEGPGDRACLEVLLRPLIDTKSAAGVPIRFVPATRGDRKKELLTNVPGKAANAVRNDPDIVIVILPDLYPPNKAFAHSTCGELQAGVMRTFRAAVERNGSWDDRYTARFHVFCMIHDLEVLLLAAEEQLMQHCRLTAPVWTKPVEEQNQDDPPKRVIERLLPRYDSIVDGPRILANADYHTISSRCPNGFGSFVAFLEAL